MGSVGWSQLLALGNYFPGQDIAHSVNILYGNTCKYFPLLQDHLWRKLYVDVQHYSDLYVFLLFCRNCKLFSISGIFRILKR